MLLQVSLAVAVLFALLVVWREGFVQRFVLLRMPLLFLIALWILPWGLPLSRSKMFANLVVTESAGALFAVNVLAVLAVWVVLVCVATILTHGRERFGAPATGIPRWIPPMNARALPLGALLALPATLAFARAAEFDGARWLPCVAAYLVALALIPPIGGLRRAIGRLVGAGSPRFLRRFLLWLPAGLRDGYVDDEGRILAGHLIAVAVFVVNSAVFWAGYALLAPPDPLVPFPALGYLLLLHMLQCSFLSGAAFFWDRFRVPLLALLILILFVAHKITGSDHFFPLEASAGVTLREPLEAAGERGNADHPLVIVCAAGGGIQSAYWTASAMTGLHEDLGPPFARSLGLVSGVSGGSVGLLFYLERLRAHGAAFEAADFAAIRAAAARSALPAAAWGIVYLDLYPLQFSRFRDRAWATEQVWREECLRLLAPGEHAPALLDDWSRACAEGALPGVVFNATFMESGERLLFSTVDIPGDGRQFHEAYPEADFTAVGAARLSATFPFVAPAARAAWRDESKAAAGYPPLHVVDGGYVDNSGVLSALEWLAALNAAEPESQRRVLLIRLEPFPEPIEPERGAGGWRAGVLGPLDTTLTAWRTTQGDRWRAALRVFEQQMGERFHTVVLRPDGPSAHRFPLSWYLSPAEAAATDRAWDDVRNGTGYDELRAWFRGD